MEIVEKAPRTQELLFKLCTYVFDWLLDRRRNCIFPKFNCAKIKIGRRRKVFESSALLPRTLLLLSISVSSILCPCLLFFLILLFHVYIYSLVSNMYLFFRQANSCPQMRDKSSFKTVLCSSRKWVPMTLVDILVVSFKADGRPKKKFCSKSLSLPPSNPSALPTNCKKDGELV